MAAERKKVFFGWFVVAAGFLVMATCYTVFVNSLSLFQSSIVSDLGIAMTEYNLGVTIQNVLSIVGSLFIGGIIDRANTRLLGGLSVVGVVALLVGFSVVTAAWQLYILFALIGIVSYSGVRLLISIVVTNWFARKRAFAVGIALAGSGFGSAILSPIVSNLIASMGWRAAFQVVAVIVFLVAFPITVATFYSHPEKKGLTPYGTMGEDEELAKPEKSPDKPIDVLVGWKNIRTSSSFWLLVVGFMAMGIVNGAILPNQVTNMTSVTLEGVQVVTGGHDPLWAGSVMSAYSITVVVAKIALGAIYDRFGLRAGNLLGTVACVVACVAMCFPQTNIGPIVGAIAFGIGTCLGTVAPTICLVKQYGSRDIGKVAGYLTALEMLGAAVASVISGALFDMFHSFAPMWIICAVAAVVMGVTLVASTPVAARLVERLKKSGAPRVDASGDVIDEAPKPVSVPGSAVATA